MALSCPKCKASKANLFATVEHLQCGIKLQVVKCRICSWSRSREVFAENSTTTKIILKKPPTQEEDDDMSVKKNCLKCEKFRTMIGRGLCDGCYGKEKAAGTLDQNFPKLKQGGPRKKITEIKPPATPISTKPENSLEAFVEQHDQDIPPEVKPKPDRPLTESQIGSEIISAGSERDRDLVGKIIAMAEQERRTPAMQAIHLLEQCPQLGNPAAPITIRHKIVNIVCRVLKVPS